MASAGALRAELGEALAEELRGLDLAIARTWRALCAAGVPAGLLLAALGTPRLGFLSAAVSGVFCLGFHLELRLLEARAGGLRLVLLGQGLEALTPWVMMFVLYRTQGPQYALGSWVPPLLAAVLLIAATARLRPAAPLVLGALGGLAHVALYFAVLRPALPPGAQPAVLYGTTMQLSRALSLLLGGALSAGICQALRGVIGRAERSVRAQDLFGKYRLEARLASGGMGVVHRARYCPEGGFERVVAVKLLHSHLAEEPAFLAAFRAEAELCALLAHPNIVQVFDFGRVDAAYFLAMEFVDGLTLAAVLRRARAAKRQLSEGLVVWLGRELLEALHFAHEQARDAQGRPLHVVHRDLCPANVLLSSAGQLKLADFGIARALRDRDTTQTRTVAGHLGYMAPEQLDAAPLDARSDLFAVGVILWELLALRPLFNRGAEGPTLKATLRGEVPALEELREDVDPRWTPTLRRALASSPGDRFASAQEFSSALAELARSEVSHAEELAALVQWAAAQPEPEADPGAEVTRTATVLQKPKKRSGDEG